MNKPITLCDRCEHASGCLLEYDEGTCRKLRNVNPTHYDELLQMTPEALADVIFYELSQFPSHGSLLAYLKEEI